jgi:hypothetical protein
MPTEQPATPKPKIRWFYPTLGRLLVVLLAVEGILVLSKWFYWIPKGWAVLIAIAGVGVVMLFMVLWFVLALLFRWRFQFSIRSLLMLTIAVAIPCSWLAVEMEQANGQKELVENLKKHGAAVGYDYQVDSSGPISGGTQPGPARLRKMLGDDFFRNLTYIGCCDFPLTETDLKHLRGMKELITLGFQNAGITDEGLEYVKELKQLQSLDLRFIPITDAGLKHLQGMKQLQILGLMKTNVTDAGLHHLEGMKQLTTLWLLDTKVTDAGVAKLQKTLPNLQIQR